MTDLETFARKAAITLDPYLAADQLEIPASEIPAMRQEEIVVNAITDRLNALSEIAQMASAQSLTGLLLTRANSPTQIRDLVQSVGIADASTQLREILHQSLHDDIDILHTFEQPTE